MENKSSKKFISYVGFEEHEMQQLSPSRKSSIDETTIKLLPGELLIAEAQSVLMFSPVGDLKQGISGVLCVTNFKLTFVTSDDTSGEEINRQQNHILGHTDSCLSNIDEIYLIMGDKKRKLIPGSPVPSKIKGIFIVCKNFRTWSFSFKFSPVGHGKNVVTTLLHHAFPSRHQLLFAYDYKEAYYNSVDKKVKTFQSMLDWQTELERTSKNNENVRKNWRLSSANANFKLSPSLPQYIIVPTSVTDNQLRVAAAHFQESRPPLWAWSNSSGAALVKMAELKPTITERTQENIMLENIRKSHPQKTPMVVLDLNKEINVKLIAVGFSKFVTLCSPENIRQFWIQDNNFYSLLESSKWLKFVSYCLEKATEATQNLNYGTSVILQEGAGRDVCCIISSLIQLMSDSHFRTITGFQSLIQKEWVTAGHPFCDRLGHIINSNSEKSPIFLLYLDCVWQLIQQFPSQFEFTETYLTTLWDTAHVPIFDTFIFNCESDRILAAMDSNPLILRSAWDWHEQFTDQDISLFYSPFFIKNDKESTILLPKFNISSLEFWSQSYFRWIPPLEIINGGKNHTELFTRILQSGISQLKIDTKENFNSSLNTISTCMVQMNIDSFYPFGYKKTGNTVSTPIMNTSMLMSESLIDGQSIITAPDG